MFTPSCHNSLAIREGLHSICCFQVNKSLLLGSPHFRQSFVEALHVVSVSSSLQLHCLPFPPVLLQCTGAFCGSLQASLYAAVVDLMLLVCNNLWWAWSLLLIRVRSSWSLGSNQSWWFFSGVLAYHRLSVFWIDIQVSIGQFRCSFA